MGNNIRNTGKEKLEKWKKDLESIEYDLMGLNALRRDFKKLRKVVKVVLSVKDCKKDEPFLSSFGAFANLVLQGYVTFIVMGIRRQLKAKGNEISLIGILEDIKQNNQYISKKYLISLYLLRYQDVSNHNKEILKEMAEGDWKKLVGDYEYLPSEVVENDIKKLKDSAKEIEYFADKYVAHHDRERDDIKAGVTLNKIDPALENFGNIYKKYLMLVEGYALTSLTPTPQFNDQKFFDEFEIWLKERLCDKK